jgi:CheY-like chemotaxis protein
VLRPVARQKGLHLTLSLSTNLPTALVGDPVRLSQVLNNLIGNAIKFTDKGEINLVVTLKEATADSALIDFEVRDTGIGISPEDQAIIFNAFTQADSTDTRRFSGTGLGLSICKDLCKLMGGHIEVTSQPGVGSSFRFTARFGQQVNSVRHIYNDSEFTSQYYKKMVSAPAAVLSHAGELMPADTLSANDLLPRRHALIVEDNAVNRKVAAGFLEFLGWSVETAEDGLQALEAHSRRHFDVIFMDCQMPMMDGFEATAAIRKREATGAIRTPIIALTATADPGFRERCLDAGMDEYIAKPFTRRQLETTLSIVL